MDEFAQYMHEAELVIIHAGAGSVIHAIDSGKVPVVMPRRAAHREHINDHQVELATALAGAGKVVMVEDPDGLQQAVDDALAKQRNRQRQEVVVPRLVPVLQRLLNDYARKNSL
jgi:UDP-N-acetylglucosamine transferase subunit ALG13